MQKKIIVFVKKSILFIFGLFIISIGVALSVKANLGVSPISCIPYLFSQKFSRSLGTYTIYFNITLILIQILILRKNYPLFQMIQLPVVLFFGLFIDTAMRLVSGIIVDSYGGQFFLCSLSCIVIAIGVLIEVKADFTYLPGEGVALALTKTFNFRFGKSKMGTDTVLVVVGILLSVLFFQNIVGIREGTVLAAVAVGFLVRHFHSFSIWLADMLNQEKGKKENTA